MSSYETVIGLEIHIQLQTTSKMFCGCSNVPTEPNLDTCPVCLGLPGALPVPNGEAIRLTQLLAAGVGAKLARQSHFDRKHYFYPDLPKGYQISQYEHPLATTGSFSFAIDGLRRTVRIERLHLEEDAGKNVHAGGETMVDLGRAGTPLVEMVTEPDLHSPAEARAFLQELQRTAQALNVSEARMERGELRVDANISLRKSGDPLGAKVELKNMNSFRFIEKALEHEVERQTRLLGAGEPIPQETRGYVEKTGGTLSQRSKEEARDYRYFPEPDIPPLSFSADTLGEIESEASSRLVAATAERGRGAVKKEELISAGFMVSTDSVYLEDPVFASLQQIQRSTGSEKIPRDLDNLILQNESRDEILERLRRQDPVTITALTEAIGAMRSERKVPLAQARASVAYAARSAVSFAEAFHALGFGEEVDIGKIADEAIRRNPKAVLDYQAGNDRALDVLVGYTMQRSKGRADAGAARRLFEERLR